MPSSQITHVSLEIETSLNENSCRAKKKNETSLKNNIYIDPDLNDILCLV